MNSRRKFLRNFGLIGGGSLFLPVIDQSLKAEILQTMNFIRENEAKEVIENEDYWETIRKAFDYPTEFINLENGYYSQQPRLVLDEVMNDWKRINHLSSFYMRKEMDSDREKIRRQLADFAGIDHEELALTRNTTESLDILISGLPLVKGDEVILSTFDYGSMTEAFEQQSQRMGIVIKTIELPVVPESDEEIIDVFISAINDKTKVILVTHMLNLNGQILPAKKLCKIGKEKGIHVIVDGAHSFAHLDFKIDDLGCDYFGTSLHKWLCAPLGNGMLKVSKDRIADIWPLMGDTGKARNDIRKFEHQGTRPPASWLGIAHAIGFHNAIGSAKKAARLRYLKNYWAEKVADLPHVVLNTSLKEEHSCGIGNVGVRGVAPAELADRLFNDFNIFTVAIDRGAIQGVRVTPHLYNTTRDLDALVDALSSLKN